MRAQKGGGEEGEGGRRRISHMQTSLTLKITITPWCHQVQLANK